MLIRAEEVDANSSKQNTDLETLPDETQIQYLGTYFYPAKLRLHGCGQCTSLNPAGSGIDLGIPAGWEQSNMVYYFFMMRCVCQPHLSSRSSSRGIAAIYSGTAAVVSVGTLFSVLSVQPLLGNVFVTTFNSADLSNNSSG